MLYPLTFAFDVQVVGLDGEMEKTVVVKVGGCPAVTSSFFQIDRDGSRFTGSGYFGVDESIDGFTPVDAE